MHKNYCICTAPILSSRLFSSLIFVALRNMCLTDDDDKAMISLLEISHPALFPDRCHSILDFAL